MKADEALQVLGQLAAQYKGTLKEHEILQVALKTLGDICHGRTPTEG